MSEETLIDVHNTGHGWVRPRADGARARCGGPGMCNVCQREAGIDITRPTITAGTGAKLNADVKRDVNRLAGIFASMFGFEIPTDNYDFEESPNPNAVVCWGLALRSYNYWGDRRIGIRKDK